MFAHLEHLLPVLPLPLPSPSHPGLLALVPLPPNSCCLPATPPPTHLKARKLIRAQESGTQTKTFKKNNSYPNSGGAMVGGRFFNSGERQKKGKQQSSHCGWWPHIKANLARYLPGGPVVKTPCSQCRGHRFDPWFGELTEQFGLKPANFLKKEKN